MFKHLAFGLMATAALGMSLTSCSSDEPGLVQDGPGNVSFTVQLPADMATRAAAATWGTGVTATTLDCYVYCNGQKVAEKLNEAINITATVDFQLANGRTYDFVFYAHNAAAPYTYDAATQELAMNYTTTMASDNENLDAFYQHETLRVTGPSTNTVKLYRPFAQINVGTNDYDPQNAAIAVPNLKVGMTVNTDVASSINLLTDARSGSTNVTFEPKLIDSTITDDQAFPYKPAVYKYLSMDYVLVPQTESLVNLTLNIEGDQTDNDITLDNIPVQANYRTNIFGSFLSTDVTWNVEIVPAFLYDDQFPLDYNVQWPRTVVTTADEFNAALTSKEPSVIVVPQGTTLDFNAWQSKFMADVEKSKIIRLDGALNFENSMYYIGVYADNVDLFIDMRGGGSITCDESLVLNYGSNSSLKIAGGTLTSTREWSGEAIIQNFDQNCILDGVTINAKDMVLNPSGARVVINNCTINTAAGECGVGYFDNCDVTISGNTINGNASATVFEVNRGSIVFENNTIAGGLSTRSGVLSLGDGTATFLSGSYQLAAGKTGSCINAASGSTLTLQGGKFQGKPQLLGADATLGTGYAWKAITDGQLDWQVIPAPAQARRR